MGHQHIAGKGARHGLLLLLTAALAGCGEPVDSPFPTEKNTLPSAVGLVQVAEHRLWDGGGLNWASLSLKDGNGNQVTGRTLNDFQLSETLLDADGNVLDGPQAITFDQPDYQFDGPGFWERTVSDEKLDIVFVVDTSGTMSDEMPAIRSELHDFLDRLQANHTDFRLGLIADQWAPGDYEVFPLRGPMMATELHTAIDALNTSGEWWVPDTGYDSILHALGEMPWREDTDVRRVVVLITDTLPQSAYGSYWYLESTSSNRTGVELALQATGTEFYYSQPASRDAVMAHTDMEYYTREDTNPRAGCQPLAGGQWDCGFATLGSRISWPFQQSDIPLTSSQPLADSRYYFAWVSHYVETQTGNANRRVRVSIQTDDPANSGTKLETRFEYNPYEGNLPTLTVNMTDAHGQPVTNDFDVTLLAEMGDRRANVSYSGANTGVAGQLQYELLPGNYRLCSGYNCWPPFYDRYRYADMDYQGSLAVSLPATGLTTGWQLAAEDAEMDLYRARGLLKDLEQWGVTERPFRDFANDANAWLDDLQAGGIGLVEDEQIRRFFVALSGYVNASGYGEVEGRRIGEDFEQVLLKFRDIIERVRDLADDSDVATATSATEAAARFDLAAITEISASEATVHALKTYAEEELVPTVIDKIVEQIPSAPYKDLLAQMITGLVLGHWDDWPALLESMSDLALDQSLNEVQALAAAQLSDALFDGLDLSPEAQTVKPLVKTVLQAFAQNGFDGLDDAMASIQSQLRGLGSSEEVLVWVGDVFSAIDDQLDAGPLRDFALPMTQLVVRAAVQQDGLDDDAVIRLLAHYFSQRIIVLPHFAQPLAAELNDALAKAKVFAPTPTTDPLWDRAVSMSNDFSLWRDGADPNVEGYSPMNLINEDSWRNLARQDPIDDFTQVLSYVSDTILPVLQTLFTNLCDSAYPTTCPLAKDTKDFIAVLDAIGLMTKVVELSLKTQDLTELPGDLNHTNNVLLVED